MKKFYPLFLLPLVCFTLAKLSGCVALDSQRQYIQAPAAWTPPQPPPQPPPPPAPTATANAKELTRITHEQAPEKYPRVSPDGTKLLFFTYDSNATGARTTNIVLIDIGKAGRKLVAGPYAALADWYPDGKTFVYSYLKTEKSTLVRTPTDGVGMTFISPQALGNLDEQANVSPDGKRLAFHTLIGNSFQICCVDSSGSNFTVYTEGTSPRWHPDGDKIAFDRVIGDKPQCFFIDMNTGQVTQLTSGSYNAFPSWSPDGKWLVFTSKRDGKEHLYAMKADGSQVTQLTSGEARESVPEWASDGYIYFASDAGAPSAQSEHWDTWKYSNIWRLKPLLN